MKYVLTVLTTLLPLSAVGGPLERLDVEPFTTPVYQARAGESAEALTPMPPKRLPI